MTDLEFNDLLDAVTLAMGTAPLAGPFADGDEFEELPPQPPKPANDNAKIWPYLAFPDGWTASC